MGLDQIRNLEELSKKAADKSQEAVERERQQLRVLEQQRQELNQINRDYQESVVGDEAITPLLLAHRRAFVSKLTLRLDDLSEQRDSKRQMLDQRVSEHQQKNARHSAIESVCKKRTAEHAMNMQRKEQQQMEDAHRGLRHQQKMNREQDHE